MASLSKPRSAWHAPKTLTGSTKKHSPDHSWSVTSWKKHFNIMLELANSELAKRLELTTDSDEGVYPMNDDIVLLQPLKEPIESLERANNLPFTME
ncbi:MAG: hypothetical protein Ct9H300mP11_13530 [Chloroflexota bacterium]|nr:MAG: hypothetical protein Ct9H300mP11_13530 [Chloroflexota bacterium]